MSSIQRCRWQRLTHTLACQCASTSRDASRVDKARRELHTLVVCGWFNRPSCFEFCCSRREAIGAFLARHQRWSPSYWPISLIFYNRLCTEIKNAIEVAPKTSELGHQVTACAFQKPDLCHAKRTSLSFFAAAGAKQLARFLLRFQDFVS
jgi:hypothetical protein